MSATPENVRRGPMTSREVAEIERLAGRGLNCGQISRRLNRIPATVNWQMHLLGLRTLAPRDVEYVRNGRWVRTFSSEEDCCIEQLRMDGLSTPAIARLVTEHFGHPRSAHTIGMRLKMLANAPEPGE
jgi:hypothetical protein